MKRLATRLGLIIGAGMVQVAGFSMICNGEAAASSDPLSEDKQFPAYPAMSAADTGWMIVKVIFFLLLIIGLFFLIIKFLSQKNKYLFGRSLRSLGGLPLAQNKSLQIIEIGRSLYIVGVGDNVQLLEKIDDPEEVAYLTEMLSSGSSLPSVGFETFSGWIGKLRRKQDATDIEESDISASFQQVFHDRMQHLSDRKKMVEDLLMDDKSKDRSSDKS